MKYIITLCLALAFSSIDAQNLQFSQVLTYSGQVLTAGSGFPGGYSSPIWSVPEGKLWKIESYSSNLWINGFNVITANNGIVWLKAGDQVGFYTGSLFQAIYFISIIEFTVVP